MNSSNLFVGDEKENKRVGDPGLEWELESSHNEPFLFKSSKKVVNCLEDEEGMERTSQ